MRLVPIEKVQPGSTLARSIYSSGGQLILRNGVELKPHYLQYLKDLGVKRIYLQDKELEGEEEVKEVEDVITETTKMEARTALNNVFKFAGSQNVPQKALIDDKLRKVTTEIIEELLSQKEVVVQLSEIKTEDNYLISHSVSITALSVILLKKMNYPHSKIKRMATGFLLLDLGAAKLPEHLLAKEEDQLSDNEKKIVHEHPRYGYDMLKKTDLFTEEAGRIIYQHHERIGGQGYPQGLKQDEISIPARIAAVTDVYDTLISPRPGKTPFQPYQAINYMLKHEQEKLDPEIMQALFTFVAAYPVGTHVRLSNGDSGIVIGNTPGYTFNPKVKVLYQGENLENHPDPYEINLAQNLDFVVEEVIDDRA